MIGVYVIGGFVILLLLAIYGAVNRTSKELKVIFLAILSQKKDPWEEMVKRFEQSLDEKEED